jgi:arginyl-tRNA synthetase
VYRKQQRLLRERLRSVLQSKYQVELPQIAIEQPPDLEMGEYALPVAFELARRLKRAPRVIAAELVQELMPLEGFASFQVAGVGRATNRFRRYF